MYPELPTAEDRAPHTKATAPLPATPNRNRLPEVSPAEYEKVLISDDEEAYLEEFAAGAADRDRDDNNTLEDMNASVTSNFTEKFFPPSPTASKNRAVVDLPLGDALAAPSTPARSVQMTPQDTPMSHAPPTQYVVNDPQYEDDISTIANDTYVAKYMDSNPNQLPPTPNTPRHNGKVGGYPDRPGSPDVSAGASQPSHVYTYNKLPKSKNRTSPKDSSTSEESGINSGKKAADGDMDNKSVFSFASYSRFKGGSGWSRKNYIVAIIMTFFLLAVIGGLVYTFLRLQSQQNKDKLSMQQREPDGTEGLPGGGGVFGNGWTLRPTTAAIPTSEPTITRSNAPSPIGPSPRPTRAPTNHPTRRPTTSPSIIPTTSPTTPQPTGVPSLPPTMTPEEVLRTTIQAITSSKTMQAISTLGTAQQKAFEWLVQDPNFSDYLERRVVQRFALAVLYYSLKPTPVSEEALQTWMQYDTNECAWFTSWFENRLACGSDDIFKFLTLRNINLMGTIPSELALLTKLNSLVLSNNALTGTIPDSFGEWNSLSKFAMANMYVWIHSKIGLSHIIILSRSANLDLRSNFLVGRIPALRNVPNIINLDLSYNQLTGSMPDSLLRISDLERLDLTNNAMVGFVHDRLCAKGLTTLAVDCDKITCTCCTSCTSNVTRAPVQTPPTPPPTMPPTLPPTPGPTPPPTNPVCMDAIQVTKSCFTVGEVIIANFMNCNAAGNDWIGIYPENIQAGQHFNPFLWKWSCNSQQCFEAIVRGTVFMDINASGGALWPLGEGTYRAWLFARGGDGGAYPAKAGSNTFIVRNGGCF